MSLFAALFTRCKVLNTVFNNMWKTQKQQKTAQNKGFSQVVHKPAVEKQN